MNSLVSQDARDGLCARCNTPTAKFANGKFKKFCSRECSSGKTGFDSAAAALPAQCVFCGKPTKRRTDGKPNKWCSSKCISAAVAARNKSKAAVGIGCVACGGPVKQFASGRVATVCSKVCADKSSCGVRKSRTASGSFAKTAVCKTCANEFPSIRPTKGGVWSKFCSNKCKRADKQNPLFCTVYFRECIECSKPCVVRNSGTLYPTCSDECKRKRSLRAARDHAAGGKDRSARVCKDCAVAFIPEYGNKRRLFCSDICSIRFARKAEGGSSHRYRAKRKGVQVGRVNRLLVFERFNWCCAICECGTPRSLTGTCSPNAPELDHVIPIAKGGDHVESNTQLLCRVCNNRKGAELQTEELVTRLRRLRGKDRDASDGTEPRTTRGFIEFMAGHSLELQRLNGISE